MRGVKNQGNSVHCKGRAGEDILNTKFGEGRFFPGLGPYSQALIMICN